MDFVEEKFLQVSSTCQMADHQDVHDVRVDIDAWREDAKTSCATLTAERECKRYCVEIPSQHIHDHHDVLQAYAHVDIREVLIRVRYDDFFPETVGNSINHKRLIVKDIESNKIQFVKDTVQLLAPKDGSSGDNIAGASRSIHFLIFVNDFSSMDFKHALNIWAATQSCSNIFVAERKNPHRHPLLERSSDFL